MKKKEPAASDSDAKFIGWQEILPENVFPLYLVTARDNPYFGSAVSEKTLIRLNLRFSKQHYTKRKENSLDNSQ